MVDNSSALIWKQHAKYGEENIEANAYRNDYFSLNLNQNIIVKIIILLNSIIDYLFYLFGISRLERLPIRPKQLPQPKFL